jgi:hypothetical protein
MEPKSQIYQHIKTGGIYVVITDATIESDMESAVVYKSLNDGRVWVRPASEFYDPERFENLSRQQIADMLS